MISVLFIIVGLLMAIASIVIGIETFGAAAVAIVVGCFAAGYYGVYLLAKHLLRD